MPRGEPVGEVPVHGVRRHGVGDRDVDGGHFRDGVL